MGESNWMIIKDSDNNVHRYSSKANWKSKRRNEILRQIFPGAAVAMAAAILIFLSFFQGEEENEASAEISETAEAESAAMQEEETILIKIIMS